MIALRAAAAALGGEVAGPAAILCPGPGHSPSDRSLSVRFDPDAPGGFVVHSFANDDPILCRDHVRAALAIEPWRAGAHDLPPVPRKPKPAPTDEATRIALALRIWTEARDPRGTPVERYLAGRGLELTADVAGGVLRYHPSCPFGPGARAPCMVGLFRDLRTDAPTGVHRTGVLPETPKAERRKMLGRFRGSAIKLDGVELGLVVSEGIENALAGRQLGYRPCWALGAAGAIGSLPVLPGIEGLTILGENDASGANQRAAAACAARWAAHADVEIKEPIAPGADANDILKKVTP